ncbi:MAG TPA: cytochrome-c oxidase, cbb3-type subunit III [Devosia sp.]|jgi:cytochrome c oxidase cbb3-type subunit 3|uniref:cytochrome-c oxidase, cbb3-type subunit III n=1 Tax=Devosia sp. TaxID=1871048 RepID=UPI002DDC98AA|nr:cytochrome-c oxidase, cbb3-type subunit III [Devosia sp.]HEV2516183.1 cytochrome-c oxidase, cbb3-type subunit III [Devosia sp.]
MSDEIDKLSGVETTGHEWDGIRELNTPLPRWWLWTFYGCILFALGYTIAFPAWPMLSSATTGLLGYSSRAVLDADLAAAKAAQGDRLKAVASTPVADILKDDGLARFARAGGQSLYKVYCSQCHGTGATGSAGYPNLNDDEWVWGGTIEQIYQTITHGARSPSDADTHYNLMPNFAVDGILGAEDIDRVAKQVASFSGIEGGVASPEGQQLFADNCASCHGDNGAGLVDVGGPSLNDQIWLYGGTLEAIRAQIEQPRHGVMPAWGARLGDTAAKQLAVYVHGLGGGQ